MRLVAMLLFALVTPAGVPTAPQAPAAASSTVAELPDPFARIAVIGASASAGFRARTTLAEAVGLALVAAPQAPNAAPAKAHAAPVSFADERLFLDPAGFGGTQVQRAAAIDPTLVLAPDFLFWFGYGEVAEEDDRLENLELGLELLDELRCPLVVSRFPDMSPAVGRMLLRSQMPERATLARLDARLEAWAAARKRVAFVAMPDYLVKLRAGELTRVAELEIGGAQWRRRLMQADELHPTAQGLGVLARLCLDAACTPAIGARVERVAPRLGPTLDKLAELSRSRGPMRLDSVPVGPGSEGKGLTPPAPAPPAPSSGGG